MIREDRLFRASDAEREATVRALRSFLEGEQDVVFAYVHGSFVTEGPFHDVDVAVLFEAGLPRDALTRHVLKLASRLEAVLLEGIGGPSPPVDARALNEAPLGFRYQVLRHGRLLVSKDEALRTKWVVRTWSRYLDLKPLRDEALKEAMTSWQ
jgi:hypothetical protein